MGTDPTDEYRFGYSREELERLGYQHGVWVEANQRLLDAAGLEVEIHVTTMAVQATTPEWSCEPQALVFGSPMMEVVGRKF